MSQDIFQWKIDQTYENCQSAVRIAADKQVFGDDSIYDLHEAMERTRKAGMKLNFDKCIVKSKSCSFFWPIYSAQGVKPNPQKIQEIKQMHPLSTKQELNSFLVMVNYISQFIPTMSDLASNLGRLLKKIFSNRQIVIRRISRSWKSLLCCMPSVLPTLLHLWCYK